jgi:hypothetical protein
MRVGHVPLAERPIWTSAVQQNLEDEWESLDPDPLARLGRLRYVNNNVLRAKECALSGLSIDPQHEHCLNIMEKVRHAEADAAARRER